MSDLTHTIKLIMNYISRKHVPEIETNEGCLIVNIKKGLFFRNHISKSLERVYSNDKLTDLYSNYCKNNFKKNNCIYLYK